MSASIFCPRKANSQALVFLSKADEHRPQIVALTLLRLDFILENLFLGHPIWVAMILLCTLTIFLKIWSCIHVCIATLFMSPSVLLRYSNRYSCRLTSRFACSRLYSCWSSLSSSCELLIASMACPILSAPNNNHCADHRASSETGEASAKPKSSTMHCSDHTHISHLCVV